MIFRNPSRCSRPFFVSLLRGEFHPRSSTNAGAPGCNQGPKGSMDDTEWYLLNVTSWAGTICTVFYINIHIHIWLVVSTHLKNINQIRNLPQIRVNIKNVWNHHLDIYDLSLIANCLILKWLKSQAKIRWNVAWIAYFNCILHSIQFPFLRGKQCPTQVHHVRIWPIEPRKNPPTFHYTGWLIGILIMVHYNP